MTTLPVTLPPASTDRETIERLAARARLLSWLSLGWMSVEGAVALAAGFAAGSIALVGFGLDSVIEGLASVVIIWRFTGGRTHSDAAEHRAQRLVALQFFVLAPYVAFESVGALAGGERPDATGVGIALAAVSVIVMPTLGIAKQRLAEQLGSIATRGEGRQNILCGAMAGALLVGLVANAAVGAWWLDPVIGLAIAASAVLEGRAAWAGEVCDDCVPVGFEEPRDDACCAGEAQM